MNNWISSTSSETGRLSPCSSMWGSPLLHKGPWRSMQSLGMSEGQTCGWFQLIGLWICFRKMDKKRENKSQHTQPQGRRYNVAEARGLGCAGYRWLEWVTQSIPKSRKRTVGNPFTLEIRLTHDQIPDLLLNSVWPWDKFSKLHELLSPHL